MNNGTLNGWADSFGLPAANTSVRRTGSTSGGGGLPGIDVGAVIGGVKNFAGGVDSFMSNLAKDVVDQSVSGGAGGIASGYGGTGTPLNQAAVDNTQKAIDQIPGLIRAAMEAEARRYGNAISGYDAQEQAQRGTYDKSTTTNQQNYDSNYMDSIRAGIRGLGGLFNLLRGTGAAGGTAEDLVKNTVGGITANDIRTGADTQQANQAELDSSLGSFLTELKGKRQMADDTRENNERAARRDANTQLQDLFARMAGYYGDAGNTGQRDTFLAKAGDLTPSIARDSRTQVSRYDTTPVRVQAPNLTAFAEPAQPEVGVVPQDGQVGSGIFSMARRREQDQNLALPTGA